MKKILLLLSLFSFSIIFSQNHEAINDILDILEAKSKKPTNSSKYEVKGKKFVLMQDFDDHEERHILELSKDSDALTLIELIDDKDSKISSSNVFTGDYIRKKNIVSVRADHLENQKLPIPLTYTFYITYNGNIWYLKDINTGQRWLETKEIIKTKKD